ncbi:MAG: hypothetical protein HOW73_42395 [Polyangiaceae bacterium]|nr:hypothetical protein [Polyangiaceae bacterium]
MSYSPPQGPWHPQGPGAPGGYGPPPGHGAYAQNGYLEIEISFFFMQFLLLLVTPTVVIDGYPQKRPWGRHFIELAPGTHQLHVSFPYLFSSQCGPALAMVPIYPGTVTRMKYSSPFFMFSNGTLAMLGHAPMQALPPFGR